MYVEDIDNDGLPDIVGISYAGIEVYLNESQAGAVKFAEPKNWLAKFHVNQGWHVDQLSNGNELRNLHPRYLADVNNDGFKDIVGFGNGAVLFALNKLYEGKQQFGPDAGTLTNLITTTSDWRDGPVDDPLTSADESNCGFFNPFLSSDFQPCIYEYNSRYAADVDNDGNADSLGFGNGAVVMQRSFQIVQPVEQ